MRLLHEIAIFQTVNSKVIISLFETVKLSVSISLRNLYNSLNSIKENSFLHIFSFKITIICCIMIVPRVDFCTEDLRYNDSPCY